MDHNFPVNFQVKNDPPSTYWISFPLNVKFGTKNAPSFNGVMRCHMWGFNKSVPPTLIEVLYMSSHSSIKRSDTYNHKGNWGPIVEGGTF